MGAFAKLVLSAAAVAAVFLFGVIGVHSLTASGGGSTYAGLTRAEASEYTLDFLVQAGRKRGAAKLFRRRNLAVLQELHGRDGDGQKVTTRSRGSLVDRGATAGPIGAGGGSSPSHARTASSSKTADCLIATTVASTCWRNSSSCGGTAELRPSSPGVGD